MEAAGKLHDVTGIPPSDAQQTPRIGMHRRPDPMRFITPWTDGFVAVPDPARRLN